MATVGTQTSGTTSRTRPARPTRLFAGRALGIVAAYWVVAAALDWWGTQQNPAMPSMIGNGRWVMLGAGLVIGWYGWHLTTSGDRAARSASLRLAAAIGVLTVAESSFHLVSRLLTHASAIAGDSAVTQWYLRFDGIPLLVGLVLVVVAGYALMRDDT